MMPCAIQSLAVNRADEPTTSNTSVDTEPRRVEGNRGASQDALWSAWLNGGVPAAIPRQVLTLEGQEGSSLGEINIREVRHALCRISRRLGGCRIRVRSSARLLEPISGLAAALKWQSM